MKITGKTKQLAVIGWPIEHSLSPRLHNLIAQKLGHDCVYTALPVKPEDIEAAVAGIRALGIRGINATAPHKYDALRLVDVVDPEAEKYGSVNTIVNRGGVLYGYSTDGEGLYRSMHRAGIEPRGKNVLVLGAGGAARPVCVMLASRGAENITVINRTQSRAEELSRFVAEKCGFEVKTQRRDSHYNIVINCTSLGMEHNSDACPTEDFSMLDSTSAAVDLIYAPPETVFLKRARERGAKTLNGLGMLIYQGIAAYEQFMDTEVPDNIYDELERELVR